jgi:hypothetical protein
VEIDCHVASLLAMTLLFDKKRFCLKKYPREWVLIKKIYNINPPLTDKFKIVIF